MRERRTVKWKKNIDENNYSNKTSVLAKNKGKIAENYTALKRSKENGTKFVNEHQKIDVKNLFLLVERILE